jgi:transcriptional regulator with XRE-family HTH domain
MGLALAEEKRSGTVFGSRLRALRLERQLTQQQLAERCGMPYQNIARIERGERTPNWDTVVRIAEALEVTPDAFLAEEEVVPEPAPKKGGKKK